jgi:hypothetical protein
LAPGRSPATYTVHDIRPLRARADSLTYSVIIGPAELENRYIRRYLKRAYDRVRAVLERHQRADRAEFVRSFTELETINDKPAADFWKQVEGS